MLDRLENRTALTGGAASIFLFFTVFHTMFPLRKKPQRDKKYTG